MTKVRANNFSATNNRMVNKLQNEIKHLRDVLNIRRKGNKYDLEAQVVALKLENQKLREGKHKQNRSMMQPDEQKARLFPLKSPESYYGDNKRYDFSTDVSPKNQLSLMHSEYHAQSKRESFYSNMPNLKDSSKHNLVSKN